MDSATDVALKTVDAAILRYPVTNVAAMVRLARAATGNIRQNVTIALGAHKAVFLITLRSASQGSGSPSWPTVILGGARGLHGQHGRRRDDHA